MYVSFYVILFLMTYIERLETAHPITAGAFLPAACFALIGTVSLSYVFRGGLYSSAKNFSVHKKGRIHGWIAGASLGLAMAFALPSIPVLTTVVKIVGLCIFTFQIFSLFKFFLDEDRARGASDQIEEILDNPEGNSLLRKQMIIFDTSKKLESFVLLNLTATAMYVLKNVVTSRENEVKGRLVLATALYIGSLSLGSFLRLGDIERTFFAGGIRGTAR